MESVRRLALPPQPQNRHPRASQFFKLHRHSPPLTRRQLLWVDSMPRYTLGPSQELFLAIAGAQTSNTVWTLGRQADSSCPSPHPGSCALASLAQPGPGCFGHLHEMNISALKTGDSDAMVLMPPTQCWYRPSPPSHGTLSEFASPWR